ncbi:hypothetical protein BH23GEM9_BH23GEM9_02050 [soil metagenome]
MAPHASVRIAIIIAAGATDYLDGWWARTRGPRTSTGAVLDPVTDKVFVITVLLTFVAESVLSVAQLLIILARDFFVTAGVLLLLASRRRLDAHLEARYPGKVVTVLQIAAVLILTVLPQAAAPLVVVIAVASGWAIADYAVVGLRVLRASPQHR